MRNRLLQLFAIAGVTTLILGGCTDGDSVPEINNDGSAAYDFNYYGTDDYEVYDDYESYDDDMSEMYDEYEESAEDDIFRSAGDGTEYGDEATASGTIDRKKVVYSGSITIEATEYEDAVSEIYTKIDGGDGIIQSENSYTYTADYTHDITARVLEVSVRIPSENFRPFLDSISTGIGNVTDMYTYAENITATYYDTKARIASLEAELAQLNVLLSSATTTEEMLMIYDHIAEVQGNLDSLNESIRNMDVDVAYSTINITVREVTQYTVDDPKTFGGRIRDAFVASWQNFLRLLQNALLFIIYIFPLLLLVAVILVLVFVIRKAYFKKHPIRFIQNGIRIPITAGSADMAYMMMPSDIGVTMGTGTQVQAGEAKETGTQVQAGEAKETGTQPKAGEAKGTGTQSEASTQERSDVTIKEGESTEAKVAQELVNKPTNSYPY